MWKMSSQLETIVAAYKTLTKIPSLSGGKLNKAANKVTAKWSVRNLDKGKNTTYATSYTLDSELYVTDESDFGTDISNEILSAISPRENYKAIIREEKNGKDTKKQYLEVWNTNTLSQSVDLTALDIHGDVYADSEFGSLDWSPDEKALVYVAEKKLPKFEPYIKRKAEEKPKLDGSGETAPKKGEEYIYRQDWGEQLVGKHLSVVVVFKLATETFTVLSGVPDGMCPGQVRFSPDGNSVVGVVWETEPRRLGLIFCTNRPSYIFECTLDGAFRKLSGDGLAVRSPRLSPTGDLVWLQREAGGPHHAGHQLVLMKKNTNTITTVVDIVETEIKTANGYSFHGLYSQALPNRCFSADGKRIVLSTPQQTEIRAYVVDIESGSITDISNNRGSPYSTSVVDVRSDVILVACSSLVTPGQLYIARLPASGSEAATSWSRVTCNCDATAAVAAARVRYLQLQHAHCTHSVNSFSAIYMAPNVENKQFPLIVWPHGGPHSNFVNAYSLEAALFTTLGFASLQVNYRGSTGAGQASVRFLLKRVGDADVSDCKLATDYAVQNFPIDATKLCLMGGSHGGFLVTHLSGQYPDVYAAVVSRNPVIDVASMFNSTDIADWCAAESGFDFTEKGPVSEDQLLAMRRCSPIAHVHKVKAPTALMLGSGDKRVPHFQGLEYARRLKANGVPTRIYMYDDNHSLSSPAAEMDNLINGAHWFMEHLQL
uniref:Acylamino-acid-releasing enzyme n=1 Tax=Heliothis virescens TaxID=7102 RepID=A0A2A4JP98_HELVI